MRRPLVLLVAAVLLAGTLVPAAAGLERRRADLKIPAGDLAVSGARVVGSFTVRNSGTKSAPATSTAVKADGRRIRSVATPALAPGQEAKVRFSARVGGGTHAISLCADRRARVRERKERNNCRRLGQVTIESSTVPTDPVSYTPGSVFRIGTSPNEYWMYVPTAYDDSHRTPSRIVVFVHGCGGYGEEYANLIKDIVEGIDYLVMAPGLGKDGQCWDAGADAAPLLQSIIDVKKRFNIDPQRMVLGGYSSGSTVAGQVAFGNADLFAGLMQVSGRPFWSDENRAELIAGADWKLNIVWRAHTEDEFYPIATLRADKRALKNAGFPITFSVVEGDHPFTEADIEFLFAKAANWKKP
jgi:dienelactone hydrolase